MLRIYFLFARPKFRCYFSNSPGKYFGSSGVIQTPEQQLYFEDKTSPEPPNVARAREEGISFMTNTTEVTELGSYNRQVSFEYSPPGASNLPVNIVLMPSTQR